MRALKDFRYVVHTSYGAALPVTTQDDGALCVVLPGRSFAPGLRGDAPERYLIVSISNGVAAGLLVAHPYDLGAVRGYRLVGIERPEKSE